MKYRAFGRTGIEVSEVSFGAWAIGGSWGTVSGEDATAALNAALDAGVNFIDTADVYGDGRSEQRIAKVLRGRSDRAFVATKIGRRLQPHAADGYTRENLTTFVERSLVNLQVDALDLVQLHCPPTAVYYRPEVFGVLDDLKAAGKIQRYGVSVEKVEEAIKATEYPGVETVQIIFNIFRQRPAELFFELARRRQIGVIVRVPLASGLLSGRMTGATTFSEDDHRNFNRDGKAFDVGETFGGVPFDVGLAAVEALRPLLPKGFTMAQFALRWILMFEAVGCVIPGAKNAVQAQANVAAGALPALDDLTMKAVDDLYEECIKPHVHQRW